MASFTDSPELLTRFNPYVQQLPVEAMVSVGQQKQQQYNEGVQKIQGQIDQIAGLDVVRDVDKQYLQSKLNNLGSDLKKVAAGDFSNYQLVNSVGGMASRIGKDSNIQSAVASTARYRKELSNMEEAKKSGKSAIQNEWDFSNKANTWLSSSDIKQGFNDSYTPYIDVQKKWLDVVKGLHSDLKDVDIAYELNPDGSPNFNKTLAAMQRVSTESVSSAKIENALRSSLSPEEMNQLSIDGRFTFRGHSPESMAESSKTKYNSLISKNQSAIDSLQGLAKLSTSNSKVRKQALDTIKELQTKNSDLEKQALDEVDFILNDPEEAKAYIYKNGAISQFSQANSWEHNKNNLLANPVKAQDNWEKDYALKSADFSWKKFKDTFEMDLKAKKQQEELYGISSDAVEIFGGENTNVKSPLVAMKSDIKNLDIASKQQKIDFLKGNPEVSPDQLENLISDYKSGKDVLGADSQTIIPEKWKSVFYNIVETDNKKFRKQAVLDKTIEEIQATEEFKSLQPKKLEDYMNKVTYGEVANKTIGEDLINEALNSKTGVYIPRLVQIKTGKTESGDGETAAKTNLDHLVVSKLQQYEGGALGIKGGSEEFQESDRETAREMMKGENRKNIMYQKLTQGDKTFLVMSDGTKEAFIPLGPTELGFLPTDPNEPSGSYKDLYQAQAFNDGSTNPDRNPEIAYFQRYSMPGTKLDVRADMEWDMSDTSRNYPILMLNLGNNNWVDITVPKGLPRESAARLIKELTDEQIKQLFLNDKTVSEQDKEIIKNLK